MGIWCQDLINIGSSDDPYASTMLGTDYRDRRKYISALLSFPQSAVRLFKKHAHGLATRKA